VISRRATAVTQRKILVGLIAGNIQGSVSPALFADACARTLNGSGMCVHQAVEALTLFTGVKPEVARLYRAFAKGLAS
jgi:Shikimate 5'-dehydrogenase C-terminal domain